MAVDIEYLLTWLEDELASIREHLRIHAVAPSTTTKSPDLPQDYDPNEHSVHLSRGVRIRAGSREYFFPANWVGEGRFDLVQAQADELKQFIEAKL